jgi:hypothetical protein
LLLGASILSACALVVGIEDHHLDPRATDASAVSPDRAVAAGALALYRFSEGAGNTVRDRSGLSPPLDLSISDPAHVTWLSGGLRIDVLVLLSSISATRITARCRMTNEVSLEAWVTPANTTPSGRVLALGGLGGARSVGLIYGGLVGALQTTSGEITLDSGVALRTSPMHFVFTRAASGVTRSYVDGVLRAETMQAGDFSTWDDAFTINVADSIDINPGSSWLGIYHRLVIYDRALTPEEVDRSFIAGP